MAATRAAERVWERDPPEEPGPDSRTGQPHADVRQCFLCHQTTAWNDIKGLGRYKHH